MVLKFELLKDTKTCYRFECKEGEDFITLYLKKSTVDSAGIDPRKGITVTVKETQN